ncbi:hypothetical protein SAMN05443637_124120 [Pseudonocardia thermophila]|uniref:Uncharacterized protein n=1 Tax=Pseudonocardia thermophila TaxID=1848 RepID=A0A1M6ZR22_PSETH|nr:hypothetical protein [Pseudonocardia thermophila]SHL32894.1 hypothetical protein SAMN05443637_124120 [Pseudonocardia thermophila]
MLRSLITGRARSVHLLWAGLAYAAAAAAMFGVGPWPGLLARVREACGGLDPFDVRGGWTAAEAREMLQACGPAGRAAYLQQQLLDLVYPLAVGAVLLLATALLLRRFGGRTWPLLLPVVVMTVLDYAENTGIWFLLLTWPDVDPAVATAAGAVTGAKRIAGFTAFTLPIALAALAVSGWVRQLKAAIEAGEPRSRHFLAGTRLSRPSPLPAAPGTPSAAEEFPGVGDDRG